MKLTIYRFTPDEINNIAQPSAVYSFSCDQFRSKDHYDDGFPIDIPLPRLRLKSLKKRFEKE